MFTTMSSDVQKGFRNARHSAVSGICLSFSLMTWSHRSCVPVSGKAKVCVCVCSYWGSLFGEGRGWGKVRSDDFSMWSNVHNR